MWCSGLPRGVYACIGRRVAQKRGKGSAIGTVVDYKIKSGFYNVGSRASQKLPSLAGESIGCIKMALYRHNQIGTTLIKGPTIPPYTRLLYVVKYTLCDTITIEIN
jgi:hypothetical protein